jgi:multiple sugar transport system permease protein
MKKNLSGWLIMIPSLILFGFYIWQPLFYGVFLSLSKTRGFEALGFGGFDNYIEVFNDPVFLKALFNSFMYTIWSLVIGFLVPIVLAIIFNELVHYSGLMRVSMYLPNIVPMIATMLIWKFLLDPSAGGLLNSVLMSMGIKQYVWLQDANATIPIIVATMTWKAAGATMLVYVARLKGINQEMYEAAEIDGANIFQRLSFITVPQLYNLCRMLLILQILAVFQVLIEPWLMTGGGPNNASTTLMLLNWNYAFTDMHAGQAASVSVIVNLILIALTVVYLVFSKEQEE